ncbi:MAG: phosphatidic acid phosphatase, partial [Flavobacteriaceae bacterium]
MKKITGILITALLVASCGKDAEPIEIGPEQLYGSIDKVTEIMIHDIFSPPVASRIYAYPNIAAYEIMALNNDSYRSLAGQLRGLTAIPAPDNTKPVNYELAAVIAHMDLSRRLIFSEDRMAEYRDSLYGIWEGKNAREFNASKDYGLEVAEHIAGWMNQDNYNQTRTMPKFTVDTDDPSRWQPTPPAYMDGIEPHWDKIR